MAHSCIVDDERVDSERANQEKPQKTALARPRGKAETGGWASRDRLVQLYEAWDTAEPGKGYADKAAEWRAKLPVTSQPTSDEASGDGD